jgi:uncharacterized protein (TIGR03435 family)
MRIDETRAEELLALGVFGRGSRLGDRIEMLLERGRDFSPRASMRRVVVSGIALLGCVIAGALAPRVIAFAQTRPAFEVASVKPTHPNVITEVDLVASGGRLTATNLSLQMLIASAYGLEVYQVSGGPNWVRTDRFDITAKAAEDLGQDQSLITALGRREMPRTMALMLQSLLAGRFHLQVRHETKAGTTYALIAAKNGPHLQETKDHTQPPYLGLHQGSQGIQWFELRGRRASMPLLAERLGRFTLHAPVVDQTGITGEFDFKIEYSPGDPQPDAGPSIFTAIQDLGLKLEPQHGELEVLVIDHAEKPDAN